MASIQNVLVDLSAVGGGSGSLETQEFAWNQTGGLALKYFICPWDLFILVIKGFGASTEMIVSLSGRTTLPGNSGDLLDVAGIGGGLIAHLFTATSAGGGLKWEGKYFVRAGQRIYVNCATGTAISMTVTPPGVASHT